jgi:hypothetical protein
MVCLDGEKIRQDMRSDTDMISVMGQQAKCYDVTNTTRQYESYEFIRKSITYKTGRITSK